MRKIVMTLVVAVGAGVAFAGSGCSGSLCSYSMACPNDTKPTQDMITTAENNCKAQENMYRSDPCFGNAEDLGNCEKSNIACDASGKTDPTGTSAKIQANCSSQIANLKACCAKNTASQLCQ